MKILPAFLMGPLLVFCCLVRAEVSAEVSTEVSAQVSTQVSTEGTIDYSRDIRPLLADRCYECHGPSEAGRESGLRLDVRDSAVGEADSGARAIVPGRPGASEMIRRITIEDPHEDPHEDAIEDTSERMPPPHSHNRLSPEEIEKLREWIRQGAVWREHWAFLAPVAAELPGVQNRVWLRTPVDHFVLARLEQTGVEPSLEADPETLVRRATLDLTGLPPTLAEIDAFLADESPQAYDKLVDRLLQSPRFGEHMARFWLDAVRFGDTLGRHMDPMWKMWPYRDWVVNSFNSK